MTERISVPREIAQDAKVRRWDEIEAEVAQQGDALGKGIDEEIKSTVVGLRANDFYTTQSCEGHEDRALPWPWVEIESAFAKQLGTVVHYNTLQQKYRAKTATPEEIQEMHEYIEEQILENEKEYQRLSGLLDEFYGDKAEVGESRLTIHKGPWKQSRIEPIQVPQHAKPAEVKQLLSLEEKQKWIASYRQEMKRFASFLKNKFFNS